MHPDIQKLLEVQKVDAELARIQRDLDSLPAEEERRSKGLTRAREICDAAKQELMHAQVGSRESENNIKAADEELKKLEGRLNTVKNNAEYQATLFQIESVRKERGEIEEEGLALLDKLESLREAAETAEKKLAEEEAIFAKFKEESAGVLEEREADHARVDQGREALIQGIPGDLLREYSAMFETRDGLAVCLVEGQVCMGCYTSITHNDLARLLGDTSIVRCGSCQRLLYLTES